MATGVQQRESETDVCGQAQEGYRTSDYSGVEDTNEGQVRVACHCVPWRVTNADYLLTYLLIARGDST